MTKSLRDWCGGSLLLLGLGLAGCGGGDLDPGVPANVGYVPPPAQPIMGSEGKRPVMGASAKERKEGAKAVAAADAAALKNPPPK